jgi:hypothetical protein
MNQTKLDKKLHDAEKRKPFGNHIDKKNAIKRIMRKENKKPLSKKDTELIDECIVTLSQLDGIDIEKNTAEVEQRTDERLIILHERINENNKNHKTYKPKRLVLITVTLSILVLLFANQLVAFSFDINPLVYLLDNAKAIVNSAIGDKLEIGGITYIYQGETNEYSSIKELVEAEHIKIMYPTYLPDDIVLSSVGNINDEMLTFSFSSEKLSISMSVNHYYNNIEDEYIENMTIYESNNIRFFIIPILDQYQAVYYYADMECYVLYNDYSILVKILESMKVS